MHFIFFLKNKHKYDKIKEKRNDVLYMNTNIWEYLQKDIFGSGESVILMKKNARKQDIYHTHDFAEIVYIYSGEGKQFVGEKEYDVKRGSMIFVNCGEIHYFTTPERMTYIEILIKPELISDSIISPDNAFGLLTLTAFEKMRQSLLPFPFADVGGEERRKIEMIILEMLTEYNSNAYGCQTILSNYLNILFTYIIRHTMSDSQQFRGVPAEIMRYIDEHFSEHLSLSELAKKSFYSPKYFGQVFKKCFDMTLTEYICKKRIEEGKHLLIDTNLSIDEISRKIGWENPTLFYNNFKKYYSLTPHAYRKSSQK